MNTNNNQQSKMSFEKFKAIDYKAHKTGFDNLSALERYHYVQLLREDKMGKLIKNSYPLYQPRLVR